jgi:exosortase A-associated hydrolase 2
LKRSGVTSTVEAFFLPLDPGQRFCILHRPGSASALRGGVIYVHPFAEEMNKSRRMAAITSRRLAEIGYAVLQMDLYGCGDSSGEMVNATVSQWRSDIEAATDWMVAQGFGPLTLWGLRFGALLAFDRCHRSGGGYQRLLLWQPVTSGEAHLTQFLRVGIASDMLGTAGGTGGGGFRKRLAAGGSVEVAGYDIPPTLQQEMDAVKITADHVKDAQIEWFEILHPGSAGLPPGARRTVDALSVAGARVSTHVVEGDPFWSTVEIVDCPALIESTCGVMDGQFQ